MGSPPKIMIVDDEEHIGYLVKFQMERSGYEVTWTGAFLGLVEGALFGFVLGALLAFLWNAYHRMFVALAMARETRRELLEL